MRLALILAALPLHAQSGTLSGTLSGGLFAEPGARTGGLAGSLHAQDAIPREADCDRHAGAHADLPLRRALEGGRGFA